MSPPSLLPPLGGNPDFKACTGRDAICCIHPGSGDPSGVQFCTSGGVSTSRAWPTGDLFGDDPFESLTGRRNSIDPCLGVGGPADIAPPLSPQRLTVIEPSAQTLLPESMNSSVANLAPVHLDSLNRPVILPELDLLSGPEVAELSPSPEVDGARNNIVPVSADLRSTSASSSVAPSSQWMAAWKQREIIAMQNAYTERSGYAEAQEQARVSQLLAKIAIERSRAEAEVAAERTRVAAERTAHQAQVAAERLELETLKRSCADMVLKSNYIQNASHSEADLQRTTFELSERASRTSLALEVETATAELFAQSRSGREQHCLSTILARARRSHHIHKLGGAPARNQPTSS